MAESETKQIVHRAAATLEDYSKHTKRALAAIEDADDLPHDIREHLRSLVGKPDAYRDALLVALAVPLVRKETVDIRVRTSGGRAASDQIGRLLPKLHIKGVVGAYQNVAKNQPNLVRGNRADFDAVLTWAATKGFLEEIEVAYNYVAASIAQTARGVEPRPEIRIAALTFAAVMGLFTAMLNRPSKGAHEQFVVAALLEAALDQEGTARRVETKGVNVSDRSSKSAGDIEVFERNRLDEALEVSASDWTEKLDQAERAIRAYGLRRGHVVARIESRPDMYSELRKQTDADISILDIGALVQVLVAFLDRRSRELALLRLYDLLDQKVPSADLVNAYVQDLRTHGLAS